MARPSAAQRGYNGRWRQARERWLARHPGCSHPGCTRQAVHVHHSKPHRGDSALFWDKSLWRGLCAEHHNRDAQQVEVRGYSDAIGIDGYPTDPRHPFNRTVPS